MKSKEYNYLFNGKYYTVEVVNIPETMNELLEVASETDILAALQKWVAAHVALPAAKVAQEKGQPLERFNFRLPQSQDAARAERKAAKKVENIIKELLSSGKSYDDITRLLNR